MNREIDPLTDPEHTPYANAIIGYADRADDVRLSIPGHSGDRAAAPLLTDFFGERLLRLDAPTLLTGIDRGYNNPFSESLERAAEAFSARRTWFLTNGASQANQIAALTLAQFDNLAAPVVAQRSAHSSFIDGIILGGLSPVFTMPSIDTEHGINHGITPDALRTTLEAHPTAKAVYVISPSYFGAVADIAALADVAHAHDVPLIVDAAWGAHFGFHPELPENPLNLGADLVVSSTHKLGGSLTQSSMLHLGHGRFADALEPLIERSVVLTMSTSPSALLFASLDLARATLQTGRDRIAASIAAANHLRQAVREHELLGVVSDGFGAFADIVDVDPLRVSIDVRGLGRSGHQVREQLAVERGIYTEISTETCIVAFIAPGRVPPVDRVIGALEQLYDPAHAPYCSPVVAAMPQPGPSRMTPREAYFAVTEVVPAGRAAGRISADSLAAYPPGIPNVLPGEELTGATIDYLHSVAASDGGYVRGAIDLTVSHFRVFVSQH